MKHLKRIAAIAISSTLLAVPVMAELETEPPMPESMEELWQMYLDLMEDYKELQMKYEELLSESEPEESIPETTDEAEEQISYQSGTYIVGKTIPAGEYFISPTRLDRDIYVRISTDANGDDIVYNGSARGDYIATVYDGEFFMFDRGRATLFTGNEDVDMTTESYVVKAGDQIEPGLYLATANMKSRSGYYCIYPDSRYDDIISNSSFDSNVYFTIEEGQYLYISRCDIEKQD